MLTPEETNNTEAVNSINAIVAPPSSVSGSDEIAVPSEQAPTPIPTPIPTPKVTSKPEDSASPVVSKITLKFSEIKQNELIKYTKQYGAKDAEVAFSEGNNEPIPKVILC